MRASLFVFLISLAGCVTLTQRNAPRHDPDITYAHCSKIVVHYNDEQNKTFYSQNDLKTLALIIPEDKTGKHYFEFDSMAEAIGRYSTPDNVTLTLMHETPKRTGWHFQSKTKFTVIFDNQKFEMLCAPSTYEFGKEEKPKPENK